MKAVTSFFIYFVIDRSWRRTELLLLRKSRNIVYVIFLFGHRKIKRNKLVFEFLDSETPGRGDDGEGTVQNKQS